MTFYEIDIYLKAMNRKFVEKAEFDAKLNDRLNHMLGQYVGIAFNDPSKYPKKPFSENVVKAASTAMTPEQMVVSLKAWMGTLGGEEVVIDG